jgi:hypothetical protein
VFGVHEGKSVVVVHCDDCVVSAPDTEKGGGDYVAERGLGVVGDGFAKGFGVVASAEEMAATAEERDEKAFATKGVVYFSVPKLVGGEGGEVFRLELLDEIEVDFGYFG